MKRAQLTFDIKTHGGARLNAGRKKLLPYEAKHVARPTVSGKLPFHLCIKLRDGVPSLRSPRLFRRILKGFKLAARAGLSINQFSFESNHVHIIGEAKSNSALTKGAQSFIATVTWALRKITRYHGRVFVCRYFIRLLRTPREMRHALTYCLFNHAKHLRTRLFADVYSSAFAFGEIHRFVNGPLTPPPWQNEIEAAIERPGSWMQKHGWRQGRRD